MKVHNWRKEDYLLNGKAALGLAFMLPLIILLVLFGVKGIYPFGDRTFLSGDLYHQYMPFFSDAKDQKRRIFKLFLECGHRLQFSCAVCLLSGKPLALSCAVGAREPSHRIYQLSCSLQTGAGGMELLLLSAKAL